MAYNQRNDGHCRIALLSGVWIFSFLFFGLATCWAAEDAVVGQPAETAIQPLESIVSLIEKGRWDRAQEQINQQPADANELLSPVRDLLTRHHALEQKRRQKQQQIYQEQSEKLQKFYAWHAVNDPNATDQKVFAQVYNVWKDATEDEQADLLKQPALQTLLKETYQQGMQWYREGKYAKSSRESVQWLMTFDPQKAEYKTLSEQLQQISDMDVLLRKDACDEENRRYTTVTPETIARVFQILQAYYVEPIDFYAVAEEMVRRCSVLSDVMKTESKNRLCNADPNDCIAWTNSLEQLASDLKKMKADEFDIRDFFGVQDVMLMMNEQTVNLPQGVVLAMLAESAMAELDSYTQVVWPSGVRDFDKIMTGQFGGVGFRISKDKDAIKVLSLIPDTPAARSGLKADARILAIDGEPTDSMSVLCAVRRISGLIGTSVTLTVQYPDSEKQELLTIVRDKIVVPTVEGSRQADNGKTDDTTATGPANDEERWDYFLCEDEKIGYLRLSNFTDGTVSQIKTALEKLEAAGLAGLILDLRGNGGGLLTAATEISDLFVDEGVLLKSKGRGGKDAQWAAHKDDVKRTYPMVILIDGGSASASEIVAGVLGHQGYHRAVLVGDRSYGKGSVQEVVELGADQGKLKFTAAHYYLPNGQPVGSRDAVKRQGRDDWGIAPDVEVELFDFEVRQIQNVSSQRRNTAEPKEGQDKQLPINERMLAADPQLSTALLVLKARMAVGQ